MTTTVDEKAKTWTPCAVTSSHNPNGIDVRFSCFHKVGDGLWSGMVEDRAGTEYTIEQTASSWTVESRGKKTTGKTMEQALGKAMGVRR